MLYKNICFFFCYVRWFSSYGKKIVVVYFENFGSWKFRSGWICRLFYTTTLYLNKYLAQMGRVTTETSIIIFSIKRILIVLFLSCLFLSNVSRRSSKFILESSFFSSKRILIIFFLSGLFYEFRHKN